MNHSETNGPKGDVICAFLDRDGIMWFGTSNDGLYSYDGANFAHYSKNDGLSHSQISCIYQVANGDLWIGTPHGVTVFNGQKFSHFQIPEYQIRSDWLTDKFPVINPQEVQSIIEEKEGVYWLGSNGAGAYRYDGKSFTNELSMIGDTMPDGLKHNIIQSITKDSNGDLWFASMSHGGVSIHDGNSFTHYLPADGLSDDMVRTIFLDSNGMMWIGFNGNRNSGLTFYDGTTFKTFTEKDGLCTKNIRAIAEDAAGRLWIGGQQGMCILDNGKFINSFGLKKESFDIIVFITKDVQGNMWFGGKNGFWMYDGKVVHDMINRN